MSKAPRSHDSPGIADLGAYFRPQDAERAGTSFPALRRLVAEGTVMELGNGLYRRAVVDGHGDETVAMVAAAVPDGIVCLLTALRVHGIGTQLPHEVWLAIDRKARKPTRLPAKVRIVRFSGPMLTYGVESRDILGVPVRLTSPARTIVDCFRYRNKVGIDVALEALRAGVRDKQATIDEITRAAEICRARTVMAPYIESLAW